MSRAHLKSYEKAGGAQTHLRLEVLYELILRSLDERNLAPIMAHAETIAADRL
jgi:hypothetical protein